MPRLAKVVNVLAIRQLNKELKLLGSVEALLCTRVNMLPLDLICGFGFSDPISSRKITKL